MKLSRRVFLKTTLGSLLYSFNGYALGDLSRFRLVLLKYAGDKWNSRSEGLRVLSQEIRLRTSIDCVTEIIEIDLSDAHLFYYPFLVMTGEGKFYPFTEKQRFILKKYIDFYH